MTPPFTRDLTCSFCRRPSAVAGELIGNTEMEATICLDCAEESVQLLSQRPEKQFDGQVPTPREIVAALDQVVIGQDWAKRQMAIAAYNHYKRIRHESANRVRGGAPRLKKTNILMAGPTGSGKTLLAETLAEVIGVPVYICNTTSLTPAGYVGEDVENAVLGLLQKVDFDIAKAESGIIVFDEFDKIGRKSENPSITRDVSGESVQHALLKLIEGCEVNVPPQGGRKHPNQEFIHVNTRNILFIAMGAFEGLEDQVRKRLYAGTMGFNAPIRRKDEQGDLLTQVRPEDFIHFGLIPEMVGRLPKIVPLQPLKLADLERILVEPRGSLLSEYRELLAMDQIQLEMTDGAIRAVAAEALREGTGARGLRAIMERVLESVLYAAPDLKGQISRVTITEQVVRGEAEAEYSGRSFTA